VLREVLEGHERGDDQDTSADPEERRGDSHREADRDAEEEQAHDRNR
jgi:hypothetical protein